MAVPTTNLPAAGASFVGRGVELAAAVRRLEAGARLVTVTGPGGIGKTTFARELARAVGDGAWAGGRWLCDLSEARTADAVAAAVARVLPARGEANAATASAAGIGAALRELGPVLVVLDNCEQVIEEAAAAVRAWLDAAPDAVVLATSRERLRVPREEVIELGPLEPAPAIELFSARAGAEVDGGVAARIVDTVDRLPLAIELAAARVAVLAPTELLARLERRFEVLSRGTRGAGDRHQTLRATIDWSWELLGPAERRALAQLSVFRGGFELPAAEAVIDDGSALDLVQSLRDQSLVHGGAGRRLALYASIRDYAAEHLEDAAAVRERHARYYAELAVELAAAIEERGAADAMARVTAEQDNLMAVVEHGSDRDALRALLALDPLRAARGPLAPHAAILDRVIASSRFRRLDQGLQARARLARGRAHELLGRHDAAVADYSAALGLAGDAGDVAVRNRLLLRLGVLAVNAERFDEARDHYEVALLLAQKADDRLTEGRALSNLAVVESEVGAYPAARGYFEQAHAIYADLGDRRRQAVVAGNLANVLQDEGRRDEARAKLEGAVAALESLGDVRTAAIFGAVLGTLDHEDGDLVGAEARYRAAAATLEEVGDQPLYGVLLGYACAAAAGAGRIDEAAELLLRADARLAEAGDRSALAALRVHRAHLELARARAAADPARAAALRAAVAETIAAVTPTGRPPPQKVRAALRLLQRDLDADTTEEHALELGPDARWFQLPGGERVDLVRRHNLRRILLGLAESSRSLTGDELFALGWPGERVHRDAALNRVRVALATLRKLGLRDVIATDGDGYRLSISARLTRQ